MKTSSQRRLIGSRVRLARYNLGFSQETLAFFIGKSTATVSAIETGERLPSVETLIAIKAQLGVSLDWLTGDGEDGDYDSYRRKSG